MVMCRNSVYNTIIAIAQHQRFVCAHVKCKLRHQLRVCVNFIAELKRSQSIYVISIKRREKRKEKSMSYRPKMKCYSLHFRFNHIRTAVSYGADNRSTQSPFLLSSNSFYRESPCRSFDNICPTDTHRSIGIVHIMFMLLLYKWQKLVFVLKIEMRSFCCVVCYERKVQLRNRGLIFFQNV